MVDKSISGECPDHGEFFGHDCPSCEDGVESDREEWIIRMTAEGSEPENFPYGSESEAFAGFQRLTAHCTTLGLKGAWTFYIIRPGQEPVRLFSQDYSLDAEELRLVQGKNMVRVPLRNMEPESEAPVINAYIQWSDQGIMIRFDGYGECTAEDSEGWPILVEICDGEPRVYVWNDINSEEPADFISLANAKESLREED